MAQRHGGFLLPRSSLSCRCRVAACCQLATFLRRIGENISRSCASGLPLHGSLRRQLTSLVRMQVKAGDVIVKVGQVNIQNQQLSNLRDLILGEPGTFVVLGFQRGSQVLASVLFVLRCLDCGA